jgi:hypothetical protein
MENKEVDSINDVPSKMPPPQSIAFGDRTVLCFSSPIKEEGSWVWNWLYGAINDDRKRYNDAVERDAPYWKYPLDRSDFGFVNKFDDEGRNLAR